MAYGLLGGEVPNIEGSMSFTDFWQGLILIGSPQKDLRSCTTVNLIPRPKVTRLNCLPDGLNNSFVSANKDEPFFCYLAYNALYTARYAPINRNRPPHPSLG